MASTTTTKLRHRAETITDHFTAMADAGTDADRPAIEVTRTDIEQRLDELVAHCVPIDEAVRTVVRDVVREAGLEQSDLPAELARGWAGRR